MKFPSGEFKTCGALSIPSLEPRRKPPSPSDSIYLLTSLLCGHLIIYEGSPTPVTAFLSIAPKISISANISRVSNLWFLWSYIATNLLFLQHCFYDLRSTGRHGPNEKSKRLLAHSSIGHVGYIRTGLSCGNHRRNSITTNWYLYLCINDDKCIRHSFSITTNPCQIYS